MGSMTELVTAVILAVTLWSTRTVTAGADLAGIPSVPFTRAETGDYSLHRVQGIVINSAHVDTVDLRGSTLIPPRLREFVATFAEDIKSVLHLDVPVSLGSGLEADQIFLSLGDPEEFIDASGRTTSEGYRLLVNSSGIVVVGASPLGVWWGTRTILQQGILRNGSVPYGDGVDSPGWSTRGMMLDVGRHFYPKEFLVEMCSYMSFFKQNTFHLHLSDNLYNNVSYSRQRSMSLYARFRLWSDSDAVAGLNKFRNESYTRQDFDGIQSACASRGVTVLPEIEAPGHALVITQWKPEIAYSRDLSLLNISHPSTIPTMKTIWATFLPWFHTKVVSIGADEYTGSLTDYNDFVNEMNSFIGITSGKSVRIWGTFPPHEAEGAENIHQNVSIQHWEYFEDDPYRDYIRNNYSVVNSNDNFYVVNKYGGYPNTIDVSRTFGDGLDNGFWYPNIFDGAEPTRNPTTDNPFVLGAIAPLWNDYGPNASVYSEAYYAWRKGLPALADKQWGGNLSAAQFERYFQALHPFIPAQNLDRAISSKTDVIFSYTLTGLDPSLAAGSLKDSSPNGYDAFTDCPGANDSTLEISPRCTLVTPLTSKGRNYTLTLSFRVNDLEDPTRATLVDGADSALMLTPNITLFASGNYYSLNTTVPLAEWVDLSISGRGNRTFASVTTAGRPELVEGEFLTKMDINGRGFHWAEMAIEAPLRQIGGKGCRWTGQLRGMTLT